MERADVARCHLLRAYYQHLQREHDPICNTV